MVTLSPKSDTQKQNVAFIKNLVKFKMPQQSLQNMLAMVLLSGFIFAALVVSIGDEFLPHGSAWSVLLIWAASNLGGMLMLKLKLPALLGMLLSGIVLRNLPGDPVQGLPEEWSASIRAAGLSVILMRSGLEMDYRAIKAAGAVAMRLTAMPGVIEAASVGVFGLIIFGMPPFLSLSLGFILGAVSPAVVVIGMFDLQRRGYGVAKGIPSLVVAAASFDDVVAISGFSIFIGLAIPTGGNLAWEIAHGPLNLVFGVIGGVTCGVICSFTGLWNDRKKRTAVVFFLGMIMMFLGHHYHFTGAGAMGGLIMGITANILWQNGWPHNALGGQPSPTFAHVVEADLADVWTIVAQPLLFGVIGAAIDFNSLKAETIPKALGVVCIGVVFRLTAAFVALGGAGLTVKERIFVSLAWIPKATVQAALASVPKDMVHESMDPNDKDYEDYVAWSEDILTTAVFSIILTAPIGLIVINKLGDKWLTKDPVPEARLGRDTGETIGLVVTDDGDHPKPDEPTAAAGANGDAAHAVIDVETELAGRAKSAMPVLQRLQTIGGTEIGPEAMGPRYDLMQLWLLADELEKAPTTVALNGKARAQTLRKALKRISAAVGEVDQPRLLDNAGSFFKLTRERVQVEQFMKDHRTNLRKLSVAGGTPRAVDVPAPIPEGTPDADDADEGFTIAEDDEPELSQEQLSWLTRTL